MGLSLGYDRLLTFHILFANQRARALSPDIQYGVCCHSCLMRLDRPCSNCPVHGLKPGKNSAQIINNPLLNLHLSEATPIQWNGQDAYLIICRNLDPGA